MKFIQTIIKKFFNKEELKPLGRWNIDYCNIKINQKVDLSNEDHCGPCGQYSITKIPNDKIPNDKIPNDKSIVVYKPNYNLVKI
jgi:hypothetical protein